MPEEVREFSPKFHDYAIALASLAAATVVFFGLRSTSGISGSGTTSLFVIALLVSAWRGFGPGYLTLALGVGVVPHLYRANYSPTSLDPWLLVMLAAVSTLTSWIASIRRQTEESLRTANERTNATLRRRVAELENLYAKVPVGLCFLDTELRYVRINEKLMALQGGSADPYAGRAFGETVLPEFAAIAVPLFRRVLETGIPLKDREIAARISEDAQEDHDWLVGCSRVETEDGTVVGLQVVVQDITERKRGERALSRANEELLQFTYLAAHDLQEPLRTVVSFSQLAQRKAAGTLNAEADSHLNRVIGAANRMSRLISDVLAYSQSTADVHRKSEPADLNTVLSSTLGALEHLISESHATIDITTPMPLVAGDPTRLSQVFQNLIVNAIRYRKPQVAPFIRIAAHERDGHWIFSVSDNGQGFRQEYADQIFGIFKRLHNRSVPGSGMGLAICKAVIERHGGRIWATSEEGHGANFYFTLPALRQSQARITKSPDRAATTAV